MQIVCPGRVTALTITPDGNYCIAAISENIHIWQVNLFKIKIWSLTNLTWFCFILKLIMKLKKVTVNESSSM